MNSLRFQTTPDYQCFTDQSNKDYACRYKGVHGGRGSGKSTQLARAALYRGVQEPLRILCTREYQNSISDSILALLSDQIKALGIESLFDVQRNSIYGKNGTEFIFKGLKINMQAIKSTEGIDLCLIMEAQTISEDSWQILTPTVRNEGSEIWFEWNPDEDTDPVHKRFIEQCPPNSYIREVNYDSNPWFPKVLRAEMEYDKKRDYDLYLHIWEGQTRKRSDAQVFKNYRVDGSIEPGSDEVLYYGSDFGFANDPTTLVRMWIDNDKRELYIDQEAYGIGVEIDETAALYDSIPDARRWTITADSARPETISYLKREGFNIRSSKKGPGSVIEGVKFLQSYDIVVHSRCKHTIAELGSYRWKVNKLNNEILPILEDQNNHIIDACRYALESLFGRVRINVA